MKPIFKDRNDKLGMDKKLTLGQMQKIKAREDYFQKKYRPEVGIDLGGKSVERVLDEMDRESQARANPLVF